MSEPNPSGNDCKAKSTLELRVEFSGGIQRVGVVVDGKQVFGSESTGRVSVDMAVDQFMDIYHNSRPRTKAQC